jgi:hypothetical protein
MSTVKIIQDKSEYYYLISQFLGAFAKLQKVTISFIMSAWNNATATGRILMKLDLSFSQKSVKKIQVSLKSDENYGYFT